MAAAENNISQSSFSKHIMALENEMGVKLFYRNRKSISLTPAGERLQKHAYAILGSYKSMMDDMACYSQDDIVISIFSIPVFVQYQIPEIMSAFRALHPQVKRMREYYFDSRKEGRQRTDEEHYTELEKLADGLHISAVIVDPSAASFIEVIRRHGRFRVEKASNAVIDGIRNVATRLQCGDIFICDCCADCIREFGMYRWDEKALMDKPIKENDHSMDDVRYFVHKVFAPELFSFK